MTRRRHRAHHLDADLKLDPMVDVVFQLLVFFLFAFNVKQMEVILQARVAREGAAAEHNSKGPVQAVLEADAAGGLALIRVGAEEYPSPGALATALPKLAEGRPAEDRRVILWPARELHYEHVVEVSQVVTRGGWTIQFGHGSGGGS